jgi:hypothetical protein
MPGSRNVAFHDASYKQRFIQRAQKEGLVFSPEVTGVKNPRQVEASRWRDFAWLWQPKRLAFSLALVALGFWLGSLGASRALKVNVPPPSPELANVREENSRLRQQIEQFTTQPPKVQPEALISQPRPMAPAATTPTSSGSLLRRGETLLRLWRALRFSMRNCRRLPANWQA